MKMRKLVNIKTTIFWFMVHGCSRKQYRSTSSKQWSRVDVVVPRLPICLIKYVRVSVYTNLFTFMLNSFVFFLLSGWCEEVCVEKWQQQRSERGNIFYLLCFIINQVSIFGAWKTIFPLLLLFFLEIKLSTMGIPTGMSLSVPPSSQGDVFSSSLSELVCKNLATPMFLYFIFF